MEKTNKILSKIWKIIKLIFKWGTSPLWFPWKLLFFKKEEKKFKNINIKTKVIRVITNPFVIPLKFMIFLLIIFLEIFVIYKVRYSPIMYPITKWQVESYYLDDNSDQSFFGIIEVNASVESTNNIDVYQDDINEALNYIEEWSFFERNNMYKLLNSKSVKLLFEYFNPDVMKHFLDKFNDNEEYREAVRYTIKDIDILISQVVKSPEMQEFLYEIVSVFTEFLNITTYALDFNMILDMLGVAAELDGAGDIPKFSTGLVDAIYDMCLNYYNGDSLFKAIENSCSVNRCGW